MHGRCIVSDYGSAYQPVCSRLVSELQRGHCSYSSFLKSLLSVLNQALESLEKAQSVIGQGRTVDCRIDAQRLATTKV
ncbi:hypothetical protein, partial [Anaplasma phagocytophilum]